jgi:predicted TIM-barrel fold metal-dependent hydrolase
MRSIKVIRTTQYFLGVLFICLAGTVAFSQTADSSGPDELLLKDYHPQSIYQIPQTSVTRAKFPIIDMHTHVYAKTPAQIATWIKTMDEVGVDKCIVLTGTTGQAFDAICAQYARHLDRFELWCGFDYSGYDQADFGPAAVKELERCYRMGARGVGELGDKGKGLFYSKPTKAWGMHLDDPRMDSLLEKCGELNMPINIHVADPKWMYEPMDARNDGLMNAYKWRLDNQPDAVGHAGMITILERAVKRHPRTTFIACHFANCSHDLNRLGQLFDQCPNLYADISARYAETAPIPRFTAQFYQRYQDRLVYGTDMGTSRRMYQITLRILETADEHFYARDYFTYHWPLHGLNLSDEILKKVYQQNAARILAPPPKP